MGGMGGNGGNERRKDCIVGLEFRVSDQLLMEDEVRSIAFLNAAISHFGAEHLILSAIPKKLTRFKLFAKRHFLKFFFLSSVLVDMT
jgi:hypothetical protein